MLPEGLGLLQTASSKSSTIVLWGGQVHAVRMLGSGTGQPYLTGGQQQCR